MVTLAPKPWRNYRPRGSAPQGAGRTGPCPIRLAAGSAPGRRGPAAIALARSRCEKSREDGALGQGFRASLTAENMAVTCGYAGALAGGTLGRTRTPSLLIRRYQRGHPDPFRPVRDLGRVSARCSGKSEDLEGRSAAWLPAWLPVASTPGVPRRPGPGRRGRVWPVLARLKRSVPLVDRGDLEFSSHM